MDDPLCSLIGALSPIALKLSQLYKQFDENTFLREGDDKVKFENEKIDSPF